jgi:hypothetical protein
MQRGARPSTSFNAFGFVHFLEKKRRVAPFREGEEEDDDSAPFLHGAGGKTVARCSGARRCGQ